MLVEKNLEYSRSDKEIRSHVHQPLEALVTILKKAWCNDGRPLSWYNHLNDEFNRIEYPIGSNYTLDPSNSLGMDALTFEHLGQ